MEEREFRQFQQDVIDRLARIETRLDQITGAAKPTSTWQTAAIEVIRVLVAALLALAGVKTLGGG